MQSITNLTIYRSVRSCRIVIMIVNPFPNTPFWDRPRFKEAADDNWNVAIKGFLDTDCIENIVEKGEIAHFEQFHLFPQCLPFFLMC